MDYATYLRLRAQLLATRPSREVVRAPETTEELLKAMSETLRESREVRGETVMIVGDIELIGFDEDNDDIGF